MSPISIARSSKRSRVIGRRSARKDPLIFQRDTAFQLALRLTMRRILATLAVVVALLFSAGSAWADWDDGVAAAQRGDFATAFQEWRPLAEQGDAWAQGAIGTLYDHGMGVPQSHAEAMKWYRKAAKQINPKIDAGRVNSAAANGDSSNGGATAAAQAKRRLVGRPRKAAKLRS